MRSTCYSQILTKTQFSRQMFEKYADIKFHENPSGDSRVIPSGQTDGRTDRQTDMTKIMVALRDLTNAPKSVSHIPLHKHELLHNYGWIPTCHCTPWHGLYPHSTVRFNAQSTTHRLLSDRELLIEISTYTVQPTSTLSYGNNSCLCTFNTTGLI